MTKAKLAIFTICSNNYMPMARVLLASASRHHPEADLFVCLADRVVPLDGLYGEGAVIVPIESLAMPDLPCFTFRYNVMELNTAVKPFMFLYLLEELCYETVLYFDPDIEIFERLEPVLNALQAGASIALTPHVLHPAEGLEEPNDLNFLRAGTYNLGFLGVRNDLEALEVLHWWGRRLLHQCINDQEAGLFVDQKFIDLIPGFVSSIAIIRDAAVNVAYWNLSQRDLQLDQGTVTVDGKKLIFFHYSGFDPATPGRLSKHTSLFNGRHDPALAQLTENYATSLIANGFGSVPAATYAYGRFSSGTPIPDVVRRMFREWHPAWPADPFTTFEAQLNQPWPFGHCDKSNVVINNFLAYLHEKSPYLRAVMDIRTASGQHLLVDWFLKHAAREMGFDARLIQPTSLRFGDRLPEMLNRPATLEHGVDVSLIGYLRTTSGVGEVGRANITALAAVGMKVDGYDVDLGVVADRSDETVTQFLTAHPAGRVRLFNINADQLPLVMADMAPLLQDKAYTIVNPAWELSVFPEAWIPAFDAVDEVWAQSRFIQLMLAPRLKKPVVYMPVPLEIPAVAALRRQDFGLPDRRFLFFFAFDFLSFVERKNPSGAIEAFRRAFPNDGRSARPGLVIKTLNGHLAPASLQALRLQIDHDPDIFLVERTLARPEVSALIALCDAVTSLHRAEGFGLLIAEAMLLRRPVIATDYSATTELVMPSTGYPVDCRLISVTKGSYPFSDEQVWADPDLDHAAWLMSRLVVDPALALAPVAAASAHLRTHYGPRVVAERQRSRLRELALVR